MNSIDPLNVKIASLLGECIKNGSIAHAYLFTGGSREAREELGKWFAQALLCSSEEVPCGQCLLCRKFLHGNHEDLISISKEKDRETISVEQISSLIDRISLKPFGKRHVVVIYDADLMNAAAQNKLLKTLEEPVSEAVMILLSDREESLLATVLSRCIKFYVNSQSEEAPEDIKAAAEGFARAFISGAPYYIKKNIIMPVISDKETGREKALLFLDALEELLCAELKAEAGLQNAGRTEMAAEQENVVRQIVGQAGNAAEQSSKTDRIAELIRQTELSRKYLRQLHSVQWTLKQLCLR